MDWTPERDCKMSPDRLYRYHLRIRWTSGPLIMFIGLNPSTADESKDDPTIRRLRGFAQQWGFGGLLMTNLFAWRATNPAEMMKATDPVGPENNFGDLLLYRNECHRVIACWGHHGSYRDRGRDVMRVIHGLEVFGWTSNRQPLHPLYLKKTMQPFPIEKENQ